jgi:P27 family predicted phage terminase small subunit
MRGRKPSPTKLKIVRGNPGKRRVNTSEPEHPPMPDETCPADLVDPAARAEWDRVATQLIRVGQVSMVDRVTLIGYCLKYAQWKALEAEARLHPFIVKAPSGYPIPNPALGMANKVFALMLKAAAELGITPASRSRVTSDRSRKPTTSKLEAWQKRRAQG